MLKSANSGRVTWPTALTLVSLIVARMVIVIFVRLETWPARTARGSTAELERLGKDLRAAFIDIANLQRRTTINNRVYMAQTKPVSELAIMARRIEIHTEF